MAKRKPKVTTIPEDTAATAVDNTVAVEAPAVDAPIVNEPEDTIVKAPVSEPEVPEKETVEEPKEKPKKAPVAKKATKLSGNDFKSVMASVEGDKTLVHLSATFKRYVDKVFVNPVTESEMAAMNYDLFRTLISAINTEDYNEFKIKFDFINKVFLVEKEDMFSPVTLNRNDLHWKHGSNNRFNYAILTEFISNMAHPGNRTKYAAKTNTDTVTSFLSDKGSFNLTKYYKL